MKGNLKLKERKKWMNSPCVLNRIQSSHQRTYVGVEGWYSSLHIHTIFHVILMRVAQSSVPSEKID